MDTQQIYCVGKHPSGMHNYVFFVSFKISNEYPLMSFNFKKREEVFLEQIKTLVIFNVIFFQRIVLFSVKMYCL